MKRHTYIAWSSDESKHLMPSVRRYAPRRHLMMRDDDIDGIPDLGVAEIQKFERN